MRGGNRIVGEYGHPGYGYHKSPDKDQDRDKILHVGEYTILCVFDGHGPSGHLISEFANNRLPELIQSKLTPGLDSPAIQQILIDSFATCAGEVKVKSEARISGTTATVVIITPTHIVVANAGDSPALLFNKSGTLLAHTNDHDYENEAERSRVLSEGGRWIQDLQGIYRLNGALMTTRGFGDLASGLAKSDVPELYTWPNTPDTYVSVSSDSFAEVLVGSDIKPLNGPREMVAELYDALRKANFNLVNAAQRAVRTRVEKFGPLEFEGDQYYGDNTVLILASTMDSATPVASVAAAAAESATVAVAATAAVAAGTPGATIASPVPATANNVKYSKNGRTITCVGGSRKTKSSSRKSKRTRRSRRV